MKLDVKKVARGTQLTWNLASLKPREERISSHRIKPIVDIIGTLKIAKSSISFLG